MLVAVGGIKLRGLWAAPPFYALSWLSFAQAWRTQGCVFATAGRDSGLVFSITGWRSPAAMKHYAQSTPHRFAAASAGYLTVADRFHHFHCETRPTLAEAIARWHEAG